MNWKAALRSSTCTGSTVSCDLSRRGASGGATGLFSWGSGHNGLWCAHVVQMHSGKEAKQ